jgi:hypothetical protein
MATYIDLDSYYRDSVTYPNPANYVVESDQVRDWIREARQVNAYSNKPGNKVIEFMQTVEIEGFTLPYTAITYTDSTGTVINTHTADLQRIYLDVHSLRFNDLRMIQTIDDRLNKARFVLLQDKIQLNSLGQPFLIQYRTHRMNQAMRFSRNEPLKFTVMQEQGFVINIPDDGEIINPLLQTWCNLRIEPYYRDADYSNHGLQLTQF